MRDYMDRRVTPTKRVTSPTRDPYSVTTCEPKTKNCTVTVSVLIKSAATPSLSSLIFIAFHNQSAIVTTVLESMIFRRNHIKKGERKLTYQKYVSSEIFFT